MLIRSRGFKKFNNLTALLHARLRPLLLIRSCLVERQKLNCSSNYSKIGIQRKVTIISTIVSRRGKKDFIASRRNNLVIARLIDRAISAQFRRIKKKERSFDQSRDIDLDNLGLLIPKIERSVCFICIGGESTRRGDPARRSGDKRAEINDPLKRS